MNFIINENTIRTGVNSGTILLDFIRETQKLTGTKEACREGECGACTVIIGRLNESGEVIYKSCASCILPIGDVKNCHIVTIEGLNMENLNAVQRIILENSASQCGFCTPGIILSLTGFCLSGGEYDYDDAINALDGNICRCTGYAAIRSAAKTLSDFLKKNIKDKKNLVKRLVELAVLPEYFLNIPKILADFKLENKIQPISEETIVSAGGTDLFVQRSEQLLQSDLYFISDRKDLNFIKVDNKFICIGGGVTIEELKNSDAVISKISLMKEIALLHSSTILRNKATVAGNIVNASPIGDMTIALLALDAVLTLECRGGGTRDIKLSDFYKGYKKTDLEKCEIIREIKIPVPGKTDFFNFEKVSNRKTLDIAAVNSAAYVKRNSAGEIIVMRISAGGVAAVPLLVKKLDKFAGKKIGTEIVGKIIDEVSLQAAPIDDIRGSAEYKKMLLAKLVKMHFNKMEADNK